jgi:hypothetical protein
VGIRAIDGELSLVSPKTNLLLGLNTSIALRLSLSIPVQAIHKLLPEETIDGE